MSRIVDGILGTWNTKMLSPLYHLCWTKAPIDGQLVCLGFLPWGYQQLKKKLEDVQEDSDEFRTLTEQKDVALKDPALSTKMCFWMQLLDPENGGSTTKKRVYS